MSWWPTSGVRPTKQSATVDRTGVTGLASLVYRVTPRPRGRLTRLTARVAMASLLPVLVATVSAVTAVPQSVDAYCAQPAIRWATGPGHGVIPSTNTPSGWNTALQASATAWNNIAGSTWSFNFSPRGTFGPPFNGGWIYEQTNPPGGYQNGAPGVTYFSYFTTGSSILTWSNSYLNPAYTWNLTGTLNQSQLQADVRTIATHELGHWLYLNHPDSCGTMTTAEVAAVMWPNWTKKWAPTADDQAGIASIY